MQEYGAGTVRYGAGTVRLCRCTVVQEYGVAVGLESKFRSVPRTSADNICCCAQCSKTCSCFYCIGCNKRSCWQMLEMATAQHN